MQNVCMQLFVVHVHVQQVNRQGMSAGLSTPKTHNHAVRSSTPFVRAIHS
jgi:hypothetical protein